MHYELEQYGFIEKTMAEAAPAMVMSSASLPHVITILLDLIKAYDLVQRDQVMPLSMRSTAPPPRGWWRRCYRHLA